MQWHEIAGATGVMYETERVLLDQGSYDVRLTFHVCGSNLVKQGALCIYVSDEGGVTEQAHVAVPFPAQAPATVEARCAFMISPDEGVPGVVLRVSSTSDAKVLIQRLSLRRQPAWRVWWERITGAARYGQRSLTTRGTLNTVPPTYMYPVVAGTNRMCVTAVWPWLEICGGAVRQGGVIVLEPGVASARVLAHRMALQAYSNYRLRLAIRGDKAHTGEDRVHVDVYSVWPLYDPEQAELVVTGRELAQGFRVFEHWFRTQETPPAVMLRIMAALSCPAQVEWCSLEEVSWLRYVLYRMSPQVTGVTVGIATIMGVTSFLLIGLGSRVGVLSYSSMLMLLSMVGWGLAWSLSGDGEWYCGSVVNIWLAGITVLSVSGYWLVQLYCRVAQNYLAYLVILPTGLTWLTCMMSVLHNQQGVRMPVTLVIVGSAILNLIVSCTGSGRTSTRTVIIKDAVASLTVWVWSLAVLLGPYAGRPRRGFFSECIDGFMYAASAEYVRDPLRARAEWSPHALAYVEQVLHVVKREGMSATYAALNYVTGEAAEMTYSIWHALIHACIPVTIYVIARTLGARYWAAWTAGMLAAVLPSAQLPVFGNSMAQSTGLALLCVVALCTVSALQNTMTKSGIGVLVLHVTLAMWALYTVYRELMLYVVTGVLAYTCIHVFTCCVRFLRWRYVILIILTIVVLAGSVLTWHVGTVNIMVVVRELLREHFPYFDEGDIRTRLAPFHAFGGMDIASAAGITAKSTVPPIVGGVCASVVALIACVGMSSVRRKVAYLAWALVTVCVGLYVALAFVVPWPYALKKHLSVCALVVAVAAGVGCEWVLARGKRWVSTAVIAAMTLVLMINVAITWQLFSSAARLPHYFDSDNEEMRAAVRKYVPLSATLYVNTGERIEKFFYTLPRHRVIDKEPNKATYCLVSHDRLAAHHDTWIGGPASVQLFSNRRYALLRRTDNAPKP